jgi:hypothetical protein
MDGPIFFEDALAEALERCSLGASADEAAAAFPQFDLLPYLGLAGRMRSVACAPPLQWVEESLGRLCDRADSGQCY